MHAFILALLMFGLQAFGAKLVDRQFPHLIIPIEQDAPDTAFKTQFSGQVALTGGAHQLDRSRGIVYGFALNATKINTEISFDVPSNAASTCALNFTISVDQPAPWNLSGTPPFLINISSLTPTIDNNLDSWNHHPAVVSQVATVEIGYAGVIGITGGSVPCTKGQVAQFILSPASGRDLNFTWFELSNPIHGITYEMYE